MSRLLLACLALLLVLVGGCTSVDAPIAPVPATFTDQPLSTPVPPTSTLAPPTAVAVPSPTASQGLSPSPTASARPSSLPTRRATPSATAGPTATPTLVPASFSGSDAWQHVSDLAGDIGSRPSNTEAALRGAEYVLGRLSALGYNARLEPYTFTAFQERTTELFLKKPEEVEIVARAFVYTGRGAVEGPLVDCGLGRTADFPAAGMQGKIALIQRGGGLTFQDKVSNALRSGAAGIIVFNDRTGDFRGSLGQQASVPVAGISQFDGKRLQERLRQGPVVASLKVDAYSELRQGNNVVAGPSTTAGGRKRVVIGAHYDSVAAGPGANDNASGVAVLLELARAVRGQRYPFDLVFVAFGDEEVGLVGSKRYLGGLSSDQRGRISAMVNLDMVGVGDQMEIGGDQDLVKRALRVAQEMGYPVSEMALKSGTSSDHASFQEMGILAVFIHRAEDPNYHTALDTVEKVLPENLEAAGKLALRLLDDLSRSS